MMELFENIKINHNFWGYAGWAFKYRGQQYMHIFEGVTPKKQIIIVEDMLEDMKRLLK